MNLDSLYTMDPLDLKVNDRFFIKEVENDFTELELIESPVFKNHIIELTCMDLSSNQKRLLIYNKQFPRDLFTNKLNSGWREL